MQVQNICTYNLLNSADSLSLWYLSIYQSIYQEKVREGHEGPGSHDVSWSSRWSISLSINYLSIYLSNYLSIYLSTIYLSTRSKYERAMKDLDHMKKLLGQQHEMIYLFVYLYTI